MRNKLIKVLPILLYSIFPILIIPTFVFFLISAEKEFTLYPGKGIHTGAFTDHTEPSGGNSIIAGFDVNQQRISFSYLLRKGFSNPYAGFAIHKREEMNLEAFDTMRIKIHSTLSSPIRIFLFTYIPGYTTPNRFSSFLYMQKEIALCAACTEYTIKLSDFHTPEWWYENELSENDPRLVRNFSRVHSVSFQSGTTQALNIEDSLTLKEVGFYKSNRLLFVVFITLSLLYFTLIFLYSRLRKYKKSLADRFNRVRPAGRNFNAVLDFYEETVKIVQYIGENYSQSGLTVKRVGRACGIPVMKIPEYLKRKFGLSFPQYLNAIRLAEARRLLKETGLLISEIAFRVGFNNIPHFNRLFKEQVGLSPRVYRKKTAFESE